MPDSKNLLEDKTQATDVRIAAAESLVRGYSYSETLRCLVPIADSEEEDPLLRSSVLGILGRTNPHAAIQFLLRPFENPEVRHAAIKILDEIAPATGQMEYLLTADLLLLRGALTEEIISDLPLNDLAKRMLSVMLKESQAEDGFKERSSLTMNLPMRFGRDPRVLEFLVDELANPDEQRRSEAVYGLCALGELIPALGVVDDPSQVVRSMLAQRLGYHREAHGIDVLKQLLQDSDPKVVKEAKSALRLLKQLEIPPMKPISKRSSDLGELLAEISHIQLARDEISAKMPDQKIAEGWLGEPGATEMEIGSAESRLGVKLPPSYRQFLSETNGFDHVGPFIYRLYSAAEIDWLRVRTPDMISIWRHQSDDISREEHLANPTDNVLFRAAYLSSCLQISDWGDSAVVLLNPEVVNDAGEWEAWFYANWSPGATRYPSFADYVASELETLNDLRANPR
jgi:HEAT repeat protein